MSIHQTREKDGTLNLRVCGYLTKDPYCSEKVILFSVCYGKDKYMDVKVWKSSKKLAELAECLEKHDVVAVDGVYETYRGKDGKERAQIVADFIAVQQEPPEGDPGGEENEGGADTGEFTEIPEGEEDGELPFN